MATEKDKPLSKNAQQAEDIARKYTTDIKMAAKAMRRTILQRRIRVVNPTRHSYKQII